MFFITFVPAICDLIGTSMQQMGLVYTTTSVFQMLKGSILFFSAVLSCLFLGRKLTKHNFLGLTLCVVAMCLVGLVSVWN